jgi:CubicO group peptidase (beta-lactamase class C family)
MSRAKEAQAQSVDPRVLGALRQARSRGEVGVQVAAYLGDRMIVDAWVGTADPSDDRPVDGDTLFPCFSVAKGGTALAVHLQAERGFVDYDAPIARYWPEFAANGKDEATVAHVLSHRLGLPQMPAGITPERLGDWDWIVSRLAEMEPLYPPGTVNSYLSLTFGWVLGEIVQRTDPLHRPFGQFVQDEICRPLSIDSMWLGAPVDELRRGARLEAGPVAEPSPERAAMRERVVPSAIGLTPDVYNRTDVRQACVPATGLLANARSLARMFALLAGGGALGALRLLDASRVRTFATRRPDYDELDRTNFSVMPVGAMGYWLSDPCAPAAPGAFCSVGAGGAVAWADLGTGLAGAVCHNRMFSGVPADEHPLAPIAEAIRAVAQEELNESQPLPI